MNTSPLTPTPLDLVVIGGGPAGMSAALVAGRAMLNTVVINAETPRNAVTSASHGFLTRDGAHPAELLATAKQQLTKYSTVRYLNDTVTTTANADDHFRIGLACGDHLITHRLIIATGYRDDLSILGLDGIENVYGKSVYPCVFCDGYEHRGERLALFGTEGVTHYSPMIRLWSDDLIVFTNGSRLSPAETTELEINQVAVNSEPIKRLHSKRGSLTGVELRNGKLIERDAGFISTDYSLPGNTFAESMGVLRTRNEWGMDTLQADDFGTTNVTGLYVIGDAKTGFSGLIAAAAEGAACAEGIVHQLAAERWTAVTA